MILVTGGTGLVGSHLLYKLTNQYDNIIALYRNEDKKSRTKNVFELEGDNKAYDNIQWVKGDVTEIVSLDEIFANNKINKVYHCAAMVSFDPMDFKAMREVNIQGTANIVDLCIYYKVNKLCYVSSIATLSQNLTTNKISERNEWNPNEKHSEYSITKNGAEMEVWRASQEGVPTIIVNPGVILGNGFRDGSNKLFSEVKKGLKFYTKGITGYIGVKDVTRAMVSLMESNIKNERFVLVAENLMYKDIFDQIAEAFKVKKPSIRVNSITTSIYWRIEWLLQKIFGKNPTITRDTARAAHNINLYSSVKIQEELSFQFEPIKKVITRICNHF